MHGTELKQVPAAIPSRPFKHHGTLSPPKDAVNYAQRRSNQIHATQDSCIGTSEEEREELSFPLGPGVLTVPAQKWEQTWLWPPLYPLCSKGTGGTNDPESHCLESWESFPRNKGLPVQ